MRHASKVLLLCVVIALIAGASAFAMSRSTSGVSCPTAGVKVKDSVNGFSERVYSTATGPRLCVRGNGSGLDSTVKAPLTSLTSSAVQMFGAQASATDGKHISIVYGRAGSAVSAIAAKGSRTVSARIIDGWFVISWPATVTVSGLVITTGSRHYGRPVPVAATQSSTLNCPKGVTCATLNG